MSDKLDCRYLKISRNASAGQPVARPTLTHFIGQTARRNMKLSINLSQANTIKIIGAWKEHGELLKGSDTKASIIAGERQYYLTVRIKLLKTL